MLMLELLDDRSADTQNLLMQEKEREHRKHKASEDVRTDS